MATTESPQVVKNLHSGTFGNASKHHITHDFDPQADGDKVRLAKIPAGTRIFDMEFVHAAFGAARTLDIGYQPVGATPVADEDYWTAAAPIDVSAAGISRSDAAPIVFTEDVWLVATLAGAAGAANSDIDLSFASVYEGKL